MEDEAHVVGLTIEQELDAFDYWLAAWLMSVFRSLQLPETHIAEAPAEQEEVVEEKQVGSSVERSR